MLEDRQEEKLAPTPSLPAQHPSSQEVRAGSQGTEHRHLMPTPGMEAKGGGWGGSAAGHAKGIRGEVAAHAGTWGTHMVALVLVACSGEEVRPPESPIPTCSYLPGVSLWVASGSKGKGPGHCCRPPVGGKGCVGAGCPAAGCEGAPRLLRSGAPLGGPALPAAHPLHHRRAQPAKRATGVMARHGGAYLQACVHVSVCAHVCGHVTVCDFLCDWV